MASKIYISYRKRDTAIVLNKLYDFLTNKFGLAHIFKGEDHVPYGGDFVEEISKAIDDSIVVLVLVGHGFLTEEKLLFKENDYVRYEIGYALKQQKNIIPVLVNGAIMPELKELPEDIQKFSTKKGFELKNSEQEIALSELYEALKDIYKPYTKPTLNLYIIEQLEIARTAFNNNKFRAAFLNYHRLLDFKKEFSIEDQAYLGFMYLYGRGVDQNCELAWKWSNRAAEKGNMIGQFCLGRLFYYGCSGFRKDYKKSIEWFKKAATQGYAAAQNSLGLMYYNGEGVIEDYDQAVFWYRKAADQGNDAAQLNLGIMYSKGRGVVKDDVQAMLYYRKAADQGNRVANYNIGVLHESGKGVLKDINKAIRWYKKAADLGHAKAAERIKKIQNN